MKTVNSGQVYYPYQTQDILLTHSQSAADAISAAMAGYREVVVEGFIQNRTRARSDS